MLPDIGPFVFLVRTDFHSEPAWECFLRDVESSTYVPDITIVNDRRYADWVPALVLGELPEGQPYVSIVDRTTLQSPGYPVLHASSDPGDESFRAYARHLDQTTNMLMVGVLAWWDFAEFDEHGVYRPPFERLPKDYEDEGPDPSRPRLPPFLVLD